MHAFLCAGTVLKHVCIYQISAGLRPSVIPGTTFTDSIKCNRMKLIKRKMSIKK